MDRDAGISGSSVVISLGDYRAKRFGNLTAPPGPAANDDAAREPVKTVTVRRKLEMSGVTVKIKVPVDEFIGVAVSTTISEDGVLTSAIELVHTDPDLNYRVFEEVGNQSVVAEWQNWGKKLRLPLYIMAGDGSLLPYSQQVDGVLLGNATERRRLAAEANRRPRFLHRRKPGDKAS
ncbi:MAG: DUF6101 family protein [Devosia sp.]|jgi:hypothetical protein|nr:DUF6101 family protein [Devosiaceae bacterium]